MSLNVMECGRVFQFSSVFQGKALEKLNLDRLKLENSIRDKARTHPPLINTCEKVMDTYTLVN